MNKVILTALIFFILGCSSGSESNETKEELKTENSVSENHGLKLNDGKKWHLDEATRKNMAPIKSLTNDTAVTDLHKLASDLQQHTDKLVSECTMKGADHEALHHWLEGWLADLKDLRDGKDPQKAHRLLASDVVEFDSYFE